MVLKESSLGHFNPCPDCYDHGKGPKVPADCEIIEQSSFSYTFTIHMFFCGKHYRMRIDKFLRG